MKKDRVPGFHARLASVALKVALKLVSFVGRGDHTGVFTDRIIDAEFAIQEIGTTYYGWPYCGPDEDLPTYQEMRGILKPTETR